MSLFWERAEAWWNSTGVTGSLGRYIAKLSGLVAGLLRDLPSDCHLQDVGASQAAESGLFDQVTCPILNEDAERYLMFAAPVKSGE